MTLPTAAALALSCCLAGPLAAQKYLRTADKQFELGEYAEAIPGYERHLRKDDADDATRARLARAYRLTGRLEAAAEQYAILSRADDPSPESAFRRAVTLMELGRYGAAVEQLAAAQRLGYPGVDAVASRLEYAQRNAQETSTWEVTGEFVNSPADDLAPAFAGDEVVFASARDGEALRLFRARRDDNGFLTPPEPLHSELTEASADAPVAYSPGGQLVAFTRGNVTPGERFTPESGWEMSLQLATADARDDFAPGKAFPYNGPGYSTGMASFSPDGRRLYFASDRPGGQGGFDLYVSKRTPDGWAEPRNLGARVNTPGNEITPSATDGSLYFSSDYHPGYGGMDVYRADLVGEAAAAITNLGVGVNGARDDVGFVVAPDAQRAYFASDRGGGKGGLDLYRATRLGTSLYVEVVDAKTGEPIPNAVLDFSDCGQGKFLTGVDGAFTFKMLTTESCRPRVRKPGYADKAFTLDAARLRDGQGLKLRLNPEDRVSPYVGTVVNSRTGTPLAGVRVEASAEGSDYVTVAESDSAGVYRLPLRQGDAYVIAYAADGMAESDRGATASDTPSLGTFAMFPLAGPPAPAEPLAGLSEFESRTEETAAAPAGDVAPGWSVQVAALDLNATDISAYRDDLIAYGTVYGKREDGVLRVRVGPFATREQALAVLADVRGRGYADAFPAPEAGGAALGLAAFPPASGVDRTAFLERPGQANAGDYLVRLATYGNFANFDASSVAGLGTLTTRKRGDYVIVLLQGYDSREAADRSLEAARAAGYDDAYIVTEDAAGGLHRA